MTVQQTVSPRLACSMFFPASSPGSTPTLLQYTIPPPPRSDWSPISPHTHYLRTCFHSIHRLHTSRPLTAHSTCKTTTTTTTSTDLFCSMCIIHPSHSICICINCIRRDIPGAVPSLSSQRGVISITDLCCRDFFASNCMYFIRANWLLNLNVAVASIRHVRSTSRNCCALYVW